jgi:hypothetical protein
MQSHKDPRTFSLCIKVTILISLGSLSYTLRARKLGASIKKDRVQSTKKTRLWYNLFTDTALGCWSASLQLNLPLSKKCQDRLREYYTKKYCLHISWQEALFGKEYHLIPEGYRNCSMKSDEVNPIWKTKTMKVKAHFTKTAEVSVLKLFSS